MGKNRFLKKQAPQNLTCTITVENTAGGNETAGARRRQRGERGVLRRVAADTQRKLPNGNQKKGGVRPKRVHTAHDRAPNPWEAPFGMGGEARPLTGIW